MSNQKFRISVTQSDLEWIVAQETCPPDLFKLVSLALFKADAGYVKPAFHIKKSGGSQAKSSADARYLADLMTPEEAAQYELENGIS